MIIVVLRPFTCPVMNFITVMNVNRDTCVDYWVIRNPHVCCLKSSIKDINLNVEISFIFYNVIQICYINHTISYFQNFHSIQLIFFLYQGTQSLQVALDTHDVRRKHLGSTIEFYSRHDRTPVPMTFGAGFIFSITNTDGF